MYPEKKTNRYLEKIGNWVSGSKSAFLANEPMRQKCLTTYLDILRNELTHCEIPANCTVDHVVAYAMHVVTSLVTQRIAHNDKPAVWNDEKLVTVSTLMYMEWY